MVLLERGREPFGSASEVPTGFVKGGFVLDQGQEALLTLEVGLAVEEGRELMDAEGRVDALLSKEIAPLGL